MGSIPAEQNTLAKSSVKSIDPHIPFLVMVMFASLTISILAVFLFWQNNQLRNRLAIALSSPSPTPVSSPSPVSSPADSTDAVTLESPDKGSKISSPLTIKGTVPAGWMFEGQLMIEIKDDNGKVIGSGIGKEKEPGSWTSGNPVPFTARISFSVPETGKGTLVIHADNPSGLPEKDQSFSQTIYFE